MTANAIHLLAEQLWVGRLGWTLVHFLWQGVLIAALYAVARKCIGQARRAQIRYLLGCLALAAMLAAPIVTFRVLGAADAAPANPYVGTIPVPATAGGVGYVSQEQARVFAVHAWQDDVMPWVVIAWFAGAMIFWVRLAGGCMIAARMRSMFVRPAPVEWQRRFDEIKTRVRVSGPVRLLTSALVQVPTVVGWLRPVVLMPIGALAGLPAEHVEALLAHELAHIRRHDYLANILQSVAEALLFYHPAVWWISNHIRNERELCCDDVAVAISGDTFTYARALADLESYRPAHFTPALAANGGSLRERIGRLLGKSTRYSRPLPGPAAIVAALLIVITAYGLFAQTTARPSFDVASIKPNNLGGGHAEDNASPGRWNASMTTKSLIEAAFDLKDFQVTGGPAWLDQDNYDIVAKTPTPVDLGRAVLRPYLQSLLADRYHLKYHTSSKESPGYALVLAKGGPKLTPHSGDPGSHMNSHGTAEKINMTSVGVSMAGLATFLAQHLDQPVVDDTKLGGAFDFRLEWSRDETGQSSVASIFTALQDQLGLRLEARKVPVELIVVDTVDKPSEN